MRKLDRNEMSIRGLMKKPMPTHTPDWTDLNDANPGVAVIPGERVSMTSGSVSFGEGAPGPLEGKSVTTGTEFERFVGSGRR